MRKNFVYTCLRRESSIGHNVLQGVCKYFQNHRIAWILTWNEYNNNDTRRIQKYVLASSAGLEEVPKLIEKFENLLITLDKDKKELLDNIESKFTDLHEKIDDH